MATVDTYSRWTQPRQSFFAHLTNREKATVWQGSLLEPRFSPDAAMNKGTGIQEVRKLLGRKIEFWLRPASAAICGSSRREAARERLLDTEGARRTLLAGSPPAPSSDLRVISPEVSSRQLTAAQVMRRALLGQATSETACLGDARSAQIRSDQLRWAKVWAKVFVLRGRGESSNFRVDHVGAGCLPGLLGLPGRMDAA